MIPDKEAEIHLELLGQMRVTHRSGSEQVEVRAQPKPLRMLAYLALNQDRSHRRETLQAYFWPQMSPPAAANNLRQALWHLRRALPPDTLDVQIDAVGWHPARLPWVDALAFEAACEANDLDTALSLYGGPLLPDAYDEWAQLERERLYTRYMAALEARAQNRYQAHHWSTALEDVNALLAVDPLNETATRLAMACYWALGQREAARRQYDLYQQRVQLELQSDPLPETTNLYHRILRGETHPDRAYASADNETDTHTAHLSLLETLGAFRQGLERATAWATETKGPALAAARRWKGRFYLRMGQLMDARRELESALALANMPGARAAIFADLATVETGLGDYGAAEVHYTEALSLSAPEVPTRLRLLSSLGGLQGRLGHTDSARQTLEEAVQLARDCDETAPLAVASGNLGILLIGQGEKQGAERALQEALAAAQRADAHWLTAHLTGHLGVLAQDQDQLEMAAQYYQRAYALAETIGDRRSAALWKLNLGVVRYEQDQHALALPLLIEGCEEATAQGSRSLQAGATIFIGACEIRQGKESDGLSHIEQGLALAQEIGDRERILIGQLHKGRALAALGRTEQARTVLQRGLESARSSHMHRMESYLHAELGALSEAS